MNQKSIWDKEAPLIKFIRATLRIMEADASLGRFNKLIYWRNDGSPKIVESRFGKKFLPSDNKGQADFEIAALGQPRIHIEAKSRTGKQSEWQKNHQARVEFVGEKYFIVRNPEDFANAMRACGLNHWSLGKNGY